MNYGHGSFTDENPKVQGRIVQAQIEIVRELVMSITTVRFPALAQMTQELVTQTSSLNLLKALAKLVATAPNEEMMRWALGTFPKGRANRY